MEYQIQASSRHCSATGRELQPGEKFFSALFDVQGQFQRQDFSAEAWQGPPAGAFSFWMGKVPAAEDKKAARIDDDLLLDCLQRLEGQDVPDRLNFRFVVALLLMRRKRLRFEEAQQEGDHEVLSLRCVRSKNLHRVIHPRLTEAEMAAVQEEVFKVLGWE